MYLILITIIQLFQPQSHLGPNLLHIHSLIPVLEDIPVMPKKYEISLIMESHYSSSSKLWILREKGG